MECLRKNKSVSRTFEIHNFFYLLLLGYIFFICHNDSKAVKKNCIHTIHTIAHFNL